jgi:hypothetical protein
MGNEFPVAGTRARDIASCHEVDWVMEVIVFRSAIAARDDHEVVLAFFDGTPETCVAILKGSEESARALMESLGSVLGRTTADDP